MTYLHTIANIKNKRKNKNLKRKKTGVISRTFKVSLYLPKHLSKHSDMNTGDYLLIPLIIFAILLYPLLRRAVSLLEIFVNKYVQNPVPQPTADNGKAQTVLNLKLLAYERIILFIERMKPDSLIPRTVSASMNSNEYHSLLIREIRQEFEYNLSQQLYLGENTWHIVTNFKDNIVTLINTAASDCEPGKPASDLARKVLECYIGSEIKPDQILKAIKTDINNK